ncbi:MAG: transporter related-protein, partial [Verrucomicrobiales bacterium]|nr:transporter related-protein [Verrucomicrobiales bacterium]
MAGHPISSVDPSLESKSRTTGEVVRRVSVFLTPYKGMAIANLSCALLAQGFAFVYPRLVQFLIDDVIQGKKAHLFIPTLLGLLGAFLFRDLFNSLRIRVNNVFEQNVIFDMRKVIFSRLQRLPIGFFDQRASGDLMTRVIEDVNSVERVLIDGTETGATALLAIVLGLFLLFSANPTLAWLGMVPIPILACGAYWYTSTAHTRYRAQRKAASAMNSMVMDALQGIRQIKAYNRHDFEDQRLAERASELRNGTLGVMRVWSIYSPAMAFAGALGTVLVLWVGGLQVIHGEMT